MLFFRRNCFALLTLTVLIFSSVMVVRQYIANDYAHTRQVEDFLLLHERGKTAAYEHLYQLLVQKLPRSSDHILVQDLQRTAIVVDGQTPHPDDLVWKYHVSVNNELKHRAAIRLESKLNSAAKP